MPNGQFPPVFNLADLNGQNGFKIDGEAVSGYDLARNGVFISALGDINNDGYSDLLIGAYGYNGNTGRSYVVYGAPSVNGGLLSLSSLNGANGFKIDGEMAGDYSGVSVSTAGDINGDGHTDLAIGADGHNSNTGRSYVIFSYSGIGSNGLISLTSLNGTNGFKIDGEMTGDYSGFSIRGVGDINGDGQTDLMIGAYGHNSSIGRDYVIFGGPGVGSGGLISLTNLNGVSGFKIDGEVTSQSGFTLSTGDINGDGRADLIIGADGYNGATGRCYIVFGGVGIGGGSGLISLGGLNGTNGFKLDGEVVGDASSESSAMGDINGDHFVDLMIGAPRHNNNIGRSYVLFGSSGIGNNSMISLINLNGTNGFKLDGELNHSYSGTQLGSGDFNHDGYSDIFIGADGSQSLNETGRGYVVFGGNNVGQNGLIELGQLNGINGFVINAERVGDKCGWPINSVGDMNGDGVEDLFISARMYNNATGRVYIIFGDVPPVLVNNSLSIVRNTAAILSSANLAAYDINHQNSSLVFVPSNVTHGQFEFVSNPGVPIVNFTQAQVSNGAVRFVHDGAPKAPSYQMTVRNTGIAWTGPSPAQISFQSPFNGQFPAVFNLSDLNGQNGFKIDGEATNDQSGYSVSSAGDINGDGHADLLIGAQGHNSNTGRSYVVFGGPGVGSNGLISLSSLNGSNGFKLDGETTNDYSGFPVSSVGDINGDGLADLLIGAYPHNSGTGRSYVVFGGPGIGSGGMLALSSLNGTNGFKLDGEAANDFSGLPINSAGDINGDGWVDLLIGAFEHNSGTGRSYVVFGGPGVGSGGVLALSSLNGASGFKLDGEAMNDYSGYSASSIGDINGDRRMDLLIGAYGHNNSTGRSYVVFGGPGVGSSGLITLASLNSTNGFKLDGEVMGDLSAYSVSTAGDVNGDNFADLLIGAPGHASNVGRSYLVLGGATIGNNGLLSLSNLNGSNGFKLDGELSISNVIQVGSADINADGYSDLLIGQDRMDNQTGRSYVVFGRPTVSNSSPILLSSLNGINGFKLYGEAAGDDSGYPIRGAGDVNGDGVEDLIIGAPTASRYGLTQVGRTYVVFGDIPPVLANNSLSLIQNSIISLSATNLAAYDINHQNSSLVFVPRNITHGYFQLSSIPGTALTNFTQAQVSNRTIQFVHDGSVNPPSYSISVHSTGIAWVGPLAAQVNFTPFVPPVLVHNQLSLSNGGTVILSAANLQATDTNVSAGLLQFFASNVQNGFFHTALKNVTAFFQQNISDGLVQFTHLGNQQAPSYSVSVSDGIFITPPSPATIQFTGAPVIVNNTVSVNNTQPVILTPQDLNITVTDGSMPSQVIISISDLQNAQIVQVSNQQPVSNFTLANLQAGQIELVPENNGATPSYVVTVTSNNGVSTAPNLVDSHYSSGGISAPRLLDNYLYVIQGSSVTLNTQNLLAVQNNLQPLNNSGAVFYISSVSHGQFTLTNNPNVQISFFTEQQLQNGQVVFTQDGSRNIPGFSASVLSQGLQSASLPAQILFQTINQPPVFMHTLTDQTAVVDQPWTYEIPGNAFTDPQGDPLTLSASLFNSTTPNSSLALPGWIAFDAVNNRFSGTPPQPGAWDIGVTAQDLEGLSTRGDFALTVSSAQAKAAVNNSARQAIITSVVTGGIGLMFVIVRVILKQMANKKLLNALGEGTDKYDLEVVRPVAKEIARRVKITGFMNATTNTQMANFKGAVRTLLSELDTRGVNAREYIDAGEAKRDGFINTVGEQARLQLVKKGCCSSVTSFFQAQATPEDIRRAAPAIAAAIAAELQQRTSHVTMTKLSSSSQTLYVTPHSPSGAKVEEAVEEGALHDASIASAATPA